MEKNLVLWDRKNGKPGSEAPKIDKEQVKLVRERLWKNSKGEQVKGSVVEMKDGSQHNLANLASEVRRLLGIITSRPAGNPDAFG